MKPQSYVGRVKFFDKEKGYGFAWGASNDRSRDVFIHSNQLKEGLKNLYKGDLISFEIKSNNKGLFAVNVKLATTKTTTSQKGLINE